MSQPGANESLGPEASRRVTFFARHAHAVHELVPDSCPFTLSEILGSTRDDIAVPIGGFPDPIASVQKNRLGEDNASDPSVYAGDDLRSHSTAIELDTRAHRELRSDPIL